MYLFALAWLLIGSHAQKSMHEETLLKHRPHRVEITQHSSSTFSKTSTLPAVSTRVAPNHHLPNVFFSMELEGETFELVLSLNQDLVTDGATKE